MSTRHSELRLQGTLEPAFLPLNWKIQTGIHIKPIPADLLLLAPGLAVERDGAGLSPHIVGIFEYLGQAQYPQERREVLRGNLLKGYLQLIAKFVDQHFYIAALMDGLLKFSFTSSSVGCGSAVVLSLRCASRMSRTMLSRSSCMTWL